jgi:hypothetical protein
LLHLESDILGNLVLKQLAPSLVPGEQGCVLNEVKPPLGFGLEHVESVYRLRYEILCV